MGGSFLTQFRCVFMSFGVTGMGYAEERQKKSTKTSTFQAEHPRASVSICAFVPHCKSLSNNESLGKSSLQGPLCYLEFCLFHLLSLSNCTIAGTPACHAPEPFRLLRHCGDNLIRKSACKSHSVLRILCCSRRRS